LPVFFVVPRMALVPFTLAVKLVALVVGIGCKLFFLPLTLSDALTVFLAAIALVLYSEIRVKDTPAMGGRTLNLSVHGLPPVGEEP
jgi:hypothetical protein